MRIYTEKSLRDFEFWSGAKMVVALLTEEELDMFEDFLDTTEVTMSETDVNDFFWFDTEYIAETLGYSDFEEMYTERTKVFKDT